MPVYGTVSDLSDRLGEPLSIGTTDYKRASAALEDSSAMIDAEVSPDSTSLWPTPTAIPAIVRVICLRAAERAYRNPDYTIQRGAGGFQEGFAYQSARGVFLSDDEKALLAPFNQGGASTRSLHSVEMIKEYGTELAALYLRDSYGGDAIPWVGANDPYAWPSP
jgi:hypothetical protein